ncbi:MAG: hypothetical protein HKP58_13490, partial [Desulfatitalea sp.]|nr:hypothetical protein [Desulfatitalea sp.]NNK01414.1 hypothetical protein [Desulfatitalea sp.]
TLIWIIFGNIFMGAVHDLGSMVVSLRNQGRSIGEVAGGLINARVQTLLTNRLPMRWKSPYWIKKMHNFITIPFPVVAYRDPKTAYPSAPEWHRPALGKVPGPHNFPPQ